jgi:glycosyltransferase involved in cell wall biosynthesis
LDLVLDGLTKQSYSNFDVVLVVKPSNDGTEDLVEKYSDQFPIKAVFQEIGYVTEALNLGIKNATGDVICFLDDDAIPAVNWLQKYAETYQQFDVAGVAGDVIPVKINKGKQEILEEKEEPPFVYPLTRIGYSLWNRPLPGAEGYFTYVTRSGTINLVGNMAYWKKHGVIKSFLGMGASLSVLRAEVEDFAFDNVWILGAGWEQVLAWHIWKKGLCLVYNPEIEVFHINHEESLSRHITKSKAALFQAEHELLFYRLHGKEHGLSVLRRFLSLFYRSFEALKKKQLYLLRAIISGNVIGFKWLLFGKLHSSYDPLADLEGLREKTRKEG